MGQRPPTHAKVIAPGQGQLCPEAVEWPECPKVPRGPGSPPPAARSVPLKVSHLTEALLDPLGLRAAGSHRAGDQA